MAQIKEVQSSWKDDLHYQEGDRVYYVSDPEAWELLGVKRMQSLYGLFKASGNVGKMKDAAGKNCINIDAVLRWKEQKPARAPRAPNAPTGGGVTNQVIQPHTVARTEKTVMNGVFKGVDNAVQGEVEGVTLADVSSGDLIMWTRLANVYPTSYSFGTIKKVSPEIVSYTSDLDLELVDETANFIQDVAAKRILFVRPHEGLSFIGLQLLMAAQENDDEELKQFVTGVLEPAVRYLKERWEKEVAEKTEKYGDRYMPYVQVDENGNPRTDLLKYLEANTQQHTVEGTFDAEIDEAYIAPKDRPDFVEPEPETDEEPNDEPLPESELE